MNDPRRLVDEGGELERALLLSAEEDRPSRSRKLAALAALGLPAPVALDPMGPAGGSASSTAAAGATTGASATGAVTTGVLGLGAKWVVSVLVGAALVTTTVVATRSDPPATSSEVTREVTTDSQNLAAPVASEAIVATPAATLPAVEAQPPSSAPEVAPVVAPSVDSPRRVTARKRPVAAAPEVVQPAEIVVPQPPTRPPAPPGPSSLERELSLLDQIRSSLAKGAPDRALETLAVYSREFPAGVLAPEADALRIDTHLAAGRSDEATTLAREFVKLHPQSPLVPRYRSLAERARLK
ncbi:MAG: hypothetical protein HY791_24085 [Deltaproteobacteria bacterium]|nr:hypothetical protein [Deltaproteobacteria bacterium]